MSSTQISLSIPDKTLKERVLRKLKSRGATLKFLIISALEAYDRGEFNFTLSQKTQAEFDDTMMTEENLKQYRIAKKDLENGVNIVSQEEIYAKYL